MINLLPSSIKSQRRFGRLNVLLVKQLIGLVLIGLLATGIMLSGLQITSADEDSIDQSIAIKTDIYSDLQIYEKQASNLQSDISSIEKLFEKEVIFSKLLVEIASAIPVGVQLTGLSLTGTNTQPLQITANASSQELAGTLRKNLIDSGVFESADLQAVTLTSDEDSNAQTYSVSILARLTGSADKEKAIDAAKRQAATPAPGEGQDL